MYARLRMSSEREKEEGARGHLACTTTRTPPIHTHTQKNGARVLVCMEGWFSFLFQPLADPLPICRDV